MKRLFFAAAALLQCLATAAGADPSCPSNLVEVSGQTKNSTDPTSSAGVSYGCQFGHGEANASYDIPAGRYGVGAFVTAECGASAHVTVQDDFRIIGLPAGTPVPIVAVLHANASGAETTMTDADGHQVSFFGAWPEGSVGDVSLPIAAIAEQPFRLTFDARANANYLISGGVSASFRFTGLPPGARVVSCNGYVGDQPVAARPTSWGKLKSRYR